ncbi:MAG: TonB-dependent receptor [Tannerella sp.]|jgi:TonB-linked SusC/RagA family outer membrane protein|nr:TonB-dependent receptor [Tannerella sp.]
MNKHVKLKLFTLASMLFFFSALSGMAQEKITINVNDASLKEVFNVIEAQTTYRFSYRNVIIDSLKNISLSKTNAAVTAVLNEALAGRNLIYNIVSPKSIVISDRQTQKNKEKGTPGKYAGTVTDSNNEPIIGASIITRGSSPTGTVTDVDGKFSIEAPVGSTLTVSYIGYATQEVRLGENPNLRIVIREDQKLLNEVVVIGYGVQRKSDLTSSISKVSFDNLVDMPVGSIEMALQGQAAGVNVTSMSGRPGAGVQIRIRGIGTINNNEPLYIVDGMPVSDIAYLNMSDVESVEILKDASSAAIYGTRAANGVVMVSTKKGRSADTGSIPDLEIHIDSYYGIANPTKQLQPAGAAEYLSMVEQIYGGNSTTYGLVKTEYDKAYNTDWWQAVNRKDAVLQNYNASFSGGTSKSSFLMSGGYMSHDGIDRKSSAQRISFRINTSYNAKSWLKIGENLSVTNEKTEGGGDTGENGFVGSALRADPLYPVMDANKNDINPFNNYGTSTLTNIKNPVAEQDRYLQNRHGRNAIRLTGNAFAEIKFLKDFVYRSDWGIELSNGVSDSFTPVYYLKVDDQNKIANAWSQLDKALRWTWINTLNYSKTIGENTINAVFGYQAEEYSSQYVEGNRFGQPNNNPEFQWINGGISGDRISGSHSEDAILSYFGRVNYVYSDRYMLSASARRDGSSKFGPGNQWGTFPSVSGGWRINNEEFFKNWNLDWVNSLKIRVGWGQLGNQRISSGAYDTYIAGSLNKRFYFNGDEHVQGYGPTNAGNPLVSWERTETSNIGADITLFSNRLNITVDGFNKNTNGMLIQIPMPDMFGTHSPWENIGKVNNKGLELSADFRDKAGQFTYTAGFNISAYRNKVISLGGTKPYVDSASGSGRIGGYSRTIENEPIGFFYGFETAGIFQTPNEVRNYVNENGVQYQPNAKMGDFRFVDTDGNGVLDDNDKVNLGSPHPDCVFGFNFSVAYAGFDVSAIFNGTYGNEIFNAFKYYTHRPVGFANVLSGVVDKAWTVGSGINDQPRMTIEDTNDNFRISDFYVEDASYLRLKNLQLGYTLPKRISEKVSIEILKIYVSAQNLFTVTNYSGLDPEVATGNDRSNGIDIGVYPQTRIFQIGLNLTF